MKQQPDKMLVGRAQEGDRGAFEELVARYKDRVLDSIRARYRRQGFAGDGEDVLDETVLRAFQSLGRFEWKDEDCFLKWLLGISRNVQLDELRRKRPVLSLEAIEEAESEGPTPSQALRREERFDRLKRAVEALPRDYRDVVYLSRIEGLKIKEVAGRLGKSADSVKHLLARALRLLREKIGETQSFHLPARDLREGGERHGE